MAEWQNVLISFTSMKKKSQTRTVSSKQDIKENARKGRTRTISSAVPQPLRKERNANSRSVIMEGTGALVISSHGIINSGDDPCGRCGCKRLAHFYKGGRETHFRTRAGDMTPIIHVYPPSNACVSCKFCMCSCTEFIEPFSGQRFTRCLYDPESPQKADLSRESTPPVIEVTRRKVTRVPLNSKRSRQIMEDMEAL